MAGIWINSGTDEAGWTLGAPSPFPDEKTLHGLIAENPQLLPLAGSPQLTVLGSEVQLGAGYADILAVEPSGRPAIIEVKLAKNSEARRAIVSQVLAYAAFLQGLTVESLEQENLQAHLKRARYRSILEAVKANDQDEEVDADSFTNSLQGFLDHGNFRLVLVLDDTSDELERILAYLDAMTIQALTIDLITMRVYEVNGAQVALPQPVVLDLNVTRAQIESRGSGSTAPRPTTQKLVRSEGSEAFRDSIDAASGENRAEYDKLIAWAEEVAKLPGVRLDSTHGKKPSLKPVVLPGTSGLVNISRASPDSPPTFRGEITVFKRLAPKSLADIERNFPSVNITGGGVVPTSDDFLNALTAAYREATGAPPLSPPQETPA